MFNLVWSTIWNLQNLDLSHSREKQLIIREVDEEN